MSVKKALAASKPAPEAEMKREPRHPGSLRGQDRRPALTFCAGDVGLPLDLSRRERISLQSGLGLFAAAPLGRDRALSIIAGVGDTVSALDRLLGISPW
jgi:hypothetical protein